MDLDDMVGSAIGAAEDKLEGEAKEEKTTVGGVILRFFVSIIWVLFVTVITFVGAAAMVGGDIATIFNSEKAPVLYALGIGLCLVFALITFLIPYLRKKRSITRRCGIIAIGDALWWAYLMIKFLMQ